MDPRALLTVVMLSAVGLCSCQNVIQLDGPLSKAVGENVVFHLTTPPSPPPTSITWRHESRQIVNSVSGSQDITTAYKERISLNSSTASLELQNLSLSDSGEYSLTITINGNQNEGKTTLTVFEPISNVVARADKHELVEFNSSVTLICSASGTSPSFQWFNRSADVTESDRVLLGPDNNTLTILNVTRYDNGPYWCNATNNISVGMSDGVNLTIYYGPDSAVLTVAPEKPSYFSGSLITLSCSSESSPAAQFQWALNGTLLGEGGPELRLQNVQANQSGAYSCWAYNNITQRYKPSSPKTITVLEKVNSVAINCTDAGGTLIAGQSSVSLTCEGRGDLITMKWTKDGNPLYPSNRIIFSEENRTLSISPVETEDNGQFTCNVSNPVSSENRSCKLVVISPHPFPYWVIAIVAVIVAVIVAIIFVILKKKGKLECTKKPKAPDQSNGSMELNYADISQFQRKDGQSMNLEKSGAGDIVYSGVRLPNSGQNSGQEPTYAGVQFPSKGFGLRATTGNRGSTGDQI